VLRKRNPLPAGFLFLGSLQKGDNGDIGDVAMLLVQSAAFFQSAFRIVFQSHDFFIVLICAAKQGVRIS